MKIGHCKPVSTRLAAVMLLLSASSAAVLAGPIYHWVDENGVHHYTESAPPTDTSGVSTVAVEDTRPSDYQPDQDVYRVAEQAERMQAIRDEMAEKREQYREDQSRRTPQQHVIVHQNLDYPYSTSGWWGSSGLPIRPGRPPVKPTHPIEPPRPVTPPYSVPFRPPGR